MMPFGGLFVGWVSELIGTKNVLLIEGILALLVGILHLVHLRTVKMRAKQVPIVEETAAVDAA